MGNIILRDLKEFYSQNKPHLKVRGGAGGFARRMGYNVPLPKVKKKIKIKKRITRRLK